MSKKHKGKGGGNLTRQERERRATALPANHAPAVKPHGETSAPLAVAPAEAVNGTPDAAKATSEVPVLHMMRITIEAKSRLAVGSGDVSLSERNELGTDGKVKTVERPETDLARDAYGLPVIPGATIQGLLRSLACDSSEIFARLFGWADGEEGAAAALQVGFARVHDDLNQAIDGFVTDAARITKYPILMKFREKDPLRRDHVQLNERGVAHERAKFTCLAVPVGARFSCELALWSQPGEAAQDGEYLCGLASYVNDPAFRVGGGGRRGYGRVQLVAASYARPDLNSDPAALRKLRKQPPSDPLAHRFTPPPVTPQVLTAMLTLTPLSPWRIGGDAPSATELTHGVRLPDGTAPSENGIDKRGKRVPGDDTPVPREDFDIGRPAREAWIDRRDGAPKWRQPAAAASFADNPFLVPGSALKGPLAHRALFHWNKAKGRSIDVDDWLKLDPAAQSAKLAEYAMRPPELSGLLGSPKGRKASDARAARLFVDDGDVTGVTAIQGVDHISIDRFTGGVREGILFAAEQLVGGQIKARLAIQPPLEGGDWPKTVQAAFIAALADLCQGRLALGARSLGFCSGSIDWSGVGAEAWEISWTAAKAARATEQAA